MNGRVATCVREALWLAGLMLVAVAPSTAQVIDGATASAMKKQYAWVRFLDLELPSDPDPARHAEYQLPPTARAMQGRNVSIRGWMLPIDMDARGVKQFVLMSQTDTCHWGQMGLIDEWVMVKLPPGQSVPFVQETPITVFGRLDVGPELRLGMAASLYRMQGVAVAIR